MVICKGKALAFIQKARFDVCATFGCLPMFAQHLRSHLLNKA